MPASALPSSRSRSVPRASRWRLRRVPRRCGRPATAAVAVPEIAQFDTYASDLASHSASTVAVLGERPEGGVSHCGDAFNAHISPPSDQSSEQRVSSSCDSPASTTPDARAVTTTAAILSAREPWRRRSHENTSRSTEGGLVWFTRSGRLITTCAKPCVACVRHAWPSS